MPELCVLHLPLLLHGIAASFFWGKPSCCWKNGACEQIINITVPYFWTQGLGFLWFGLSFKKIFILFTFILKYSTLK